MTRPVARVLTLLELLQSGGVRPVAELAERLGVDERTVRRYAGHLVDLDLPVESVRGRYGGYRLAPGHRMPPLMLTDEEALAALFGLLAGRGVGGLSAAPETAVETAAAKIRRVLPRRLAARLGSLDRALTFTSGRPAAPAPDAEVLLTVAEAVHERRPVTFRYTSADGRESERAVHAYGLVAHAGRWYLTGWDTTVSDERLFRLDRLRAARLRPGTFAPPPGPAPAQRVLDALAAAPHAHEVALRVRATAAQIHVHFPPGLATVEDGRDDGWSRVALRVEHLDWIPGVLAALDRPFVVERPAELRDLVTALAARLARWAREQ